MNEQQQSAYEFLCRSDFLPVDVASYPVFKSYDKAGNGLMEISGTTSVLWGFAFNAIYKIIHGYLCSVWFYQSGAVYVVAQIPPASGTPDAETMQRLVDSLYALVRAAGLESLHLWAVEEHLLPVYTAVGGYRIQSEDYDDWNEYSYTPDAILNLAGEINFYKRKRLKKCMDTPDVSLVPITCDNVRVCLEIQDVWCTKQDCAYCRSFAGCATDALKLLIPVFDAQVYQGVLLYVGGVAAGFFIWEIVNDGTLAFVYYAQANIDNFNVYLYYMAVKEYLSGVKHVNNGHDMGKQGLRMFKSHLSAYTKRRKFLCTYSK
jgi:hypothetical protein